MKSFRVTITDGGPWTTIMPANDAVEAETMAWDLFHLTTDRGTCTAEAGPAVIQVEEVV